MSYTEWFTHLDEAVGVPMDDPNLDTAVKLFMAEMVAKLTEGLRQDWELLMARQRRQ